MEFVGRSVSKQFKGLGNFTGTIKSYSPSSGFFHVVYEDGNSEELDFAEVSLLLAAASAAEPDLVQVKPGRPGRKPKKRRRTDTKRKIPGNSAEDTPGIIDSEKCDSGDGFGGHLRGSLGVNGDLNENVNSSNWLDETREKESALSVSRVSDDSKDGIDLNAGFNFSLNDDGCDLNADLNVGKEEEEKNLKHRDCIDLNLDASDDSVENLDASVDSVENLDVASLGGSTVVTQGTKRRGCDFDLNLEVGEEYRDTEADSEDKFKVSPKFEMIEESRKRERGEDAEENVVEKIDINEDICMNGIGDHIDCAVGERPSNENWCSNGDMKLGCSLGEPNTSAIKENGMVKNSPEAATPTTHGYLGDSNIQRSSRRKRRRLPDNLISTTTETVLRRSSRRGSAQNHVSIASSAVSNPVSSSAVTAITEDIPVISGCEETDKPSVAPQALELPPSSQHLNLEGISVLDLFTIYACLRSFSTLLFLSPFKLEDFVAALKCNSPSLLFDSVHVSILQTLRKHLESLSNEGSESASDCLRSLNWDLLDSITWPIFMVEYFLIHGSGLKPGFDLGHFMLFKADYYGQPASLKVEILRCLCDDLIEVEAIKSEINRRCLTAEHDVVFERDVNFGLCKKRKSSVQITGSSSLNVEVVDETPDWNSDECCLCKMDGNLICCDGCPAAYHSRCVGVVNDLLPEGDWYCPECFIDRDKPWMKLRKSLRGAELLGVDPHGRLYFKSCGYLLVSDFCDFESAFNYYHRDELNKVIEVLRSSEISYGEILLGICKHWDIPTSFNGSSSDMPLDQLAFSETCTAKNETHEDRKLQENFCDPGSDVSNSVQVQRRSAIQYDSNNLADISNQSGLVGKLYPEDCSLTSPCLDVRQESKDSIDLGKSSSAVTTRKEGTSEMHCGIDYINYYSFGQIASSVAEEFMSKSSEKSKEGAVITEDEIISAQMKTIIKKSSKFSWPNIENLNIDMQKEKCGWCFSCKYPADDRDCLLIMSKLPLQDVSKTDVVGLQLKKNPKDHLNDISCQILSIHDRLLGLLLGPWLNTHHAECWRNSLLNACDLASVKHLLLMLVENLHHRALSADWLKHVDSVVSMGSASHVVTSLRTYSKNMNSRKRPKFSDIDSNPSSNAGSGLGMFWWRGGRVSRQVFGWKVLPRSLTSKAARQGGCTKIMGILYPDSSEYAKRSKYIAWRAAVEISTSAEQLALQVRELYSNIRWDDIENTHPLPTLDKESTKSVKLFKKVIVRRKCSEREVVKYLLDFGKRRAIPDIVRKHGSVLEEPSSERKKYWLEESYLPLYLLKNFEERRIARKSSDGKSGKVLAVGRVIMRPQEKKGFAYLFSKAERSEYYKCEHCHKDVLIREAVSCQFCRGFFHKRHAKKSAGAIVSECTYTCHRCQNGVSAKIDTNRGQVDKKRGKVGTKRGNVETKIEKVQSQKCKNSQTDRRSMRLRSKRKALAGGRQVQLKNSKKVPVTLPLRRSPRKAKCLSLQNKKHSKRKKGKKGKQSKSKKETYKKPKTVTSWQKKRTQVHHSYWLNGLLLSRKPDDERIMLFRDKKLFVRSGCPIILGHLKCQLCCEAEYASTLDYIGCELCGEWFHGEAFGLGSENIDKLIGFKCHVCRKTKPPVCPHLVVVKTDVSQLAEAQNDGSVDCSEEVPNAVPTLSEVKLETPQIASLEGLFITLPDDT